MDTVTKWAAALCVAAIGCTVMQMLAPKGGLGKIFKLITAAFFLCCLISPLLSMKSILTLQTNDLPGEVSADVLQDRVKEQFKNQINIALQKAAEQTLANYHIPIAKIEADMDTGADGSIYINSVTVYLDKQNIAMAVAAKQVLEQRLGVTVNVKILTE